MRGTEELRKVDLTLADESPDPVRWDGLIVCEVSLSTVEGARLNGYSLSLTLDTVDPVAVLAEQSPTSEGSPIASRPATTNARPSTP